jgi:hypothetical protein
VVRRGLRPLALLMLLILCAAVPTHAQVHRPQAPRAPRRRAVAGGDMALPSAVVLFSEMAWGMGADRPVASLTARHMKRLPDASGPLLSTLVAFAGQLGRDSVGVSLDVATGEILALTVSAPHASACALHTGLVRLLGGPSGASRTCVVSTYQGASWVLPASSPASGSTVRVLPGTVPRIVLLAPAADPAFGQ